MFCLIHGNWHDGSCWEELLTELEARGHAAVTPDMPIDDPATTYEERVEPVLSALRDAEEPIVVVGHPAASGSAAIVADGAPPSLLVSLCPRLGELDPPPAHPPIFRESL